MGEGGGLGEMVMSLGKAGQGWVRALLRPTQSHAGKQQPAHPPATAPGSLALLTSRVFTPPLPFPPVSYSPPAGSAPPPLPSPPDEVDSPTSCPKVAAFSATRATTLSSTLTCNQ